MGSEIWIAPLLLIPGVALLVLSTSARFGRLHVEITRLQDKGSEKAVTHHYRRARFMRNALVALYGAVALLATSSLVGTFADFGFESFKAIALMLTCLSVLGLVYAATQLIRESRLLLTVILDHD